MQRSLSKRSHFFNLVKSSDFASHVFFRVNYYFGTLSNYFLHVNWERFPPIACVTSLHWYMGLKVSSVQRRNLVSHKFKGPIEASGGACMAWRGLCMCLIYFMLTHNHCMEENHSIRACYICKARMWSSARTILWVCGHSVFHWFWLGVTCISELPGSWSCKCCSLCAFTLDAFGNLYQTESPHLSTGLECKSTSNHSAK